jgi:hypothetical protein
MNKCSKYMELLNQEVLKNLLIRLWNFINSKESGMRYTASTLSTNRNYYSQVIIEVDKANNKPAAVENMPGIKDAMCGVIVDYFN